MEWRASALEVALRGAKGTPKAVVETRAFLGGRRGAVSLKKGS